LTIETKITCILGMHRSGTSLVARLVNMLGIYLGRAERMLEPRPDNPRGFWEHQVINNINDQILARFGGSYFSPPDFPSGWQNSPKLQDLRERASELLAEEFANVPSWGWKDPRTCLTLAFWQQLLPQMQYVICVRNPVDVAHSLQKRDGLTFARSADLWVAHLGSTLLGTRGQRRMVLFYDDFMVDWTGQLDLLAQFVNGPTEGVSEEIRAQAAAFVDQELRHHSTPTAENLSHPEISVEAKGLYLLLREQRAGAEPQPGGAPLSEGLLETFAEQAIRATRVSNEREAQLGELRANRQQLEAQYEHLKEVHQNLEVHRQKVERQLAAEQERVHELKVVRERLETERAAKLEELAARLGELSESREACQALEATARELRLRVEQLVAQRDEAKATVNELRRQLSEIESSIAWKAVGKVRATKDFLIPRGTGRRKLYDLGLGVLKNGRLPRIRG